MIDFLITAALTAALGVSITCIGIGAGLVCVLAVRDFLQGGRRQ